MSAKPDGDENYADLGVIVPDYKAFTIFMVIISITCVAYLLLLGIYCFVTYQRCV